MNDPLLAYMTDLLDRAKARHAETLREFGADPAEVYGAVEANPVVVTDPGSISFWVTPDEKIVRGVEYGLSRLQAAWKPWRKLHGYDGPITAEWQNTTTNIRENLESLRKQALECVLEPREDLKVAFVGQVMLERMRAEGLIDSTGTTTPKFWEMWGEWRGRFLCPYLEEAI